MLGSLIARYGLILVFVNILLQTLGLPVPAYPTLLVTAADGTFGPALIVAVAVLAALIGDTVWFAAGRRYGHHILRFLCRLSLSQDTCVRRTEGFIERWGIKILMFAKFIPGLSTLALPMAAALGVRWRTFYLLDTIGAILWSGVAVLLGRGFAREIGPLVIALNSLGQGALGLLAIIFVLYLGNRWLQRHRLLRSLRMARISVDDLYAMMEDGVEPVIIDVRMPTRRQLDPFTIPGALTITPERLASQLDTLPRDSKIILFCNCPNEVSAAIVARELAKHGFADVHPLLGGLDAWRAAGFSLQAVA